MAYIYNRAQFRLSHKIVLCVRIDTQKEQHSDG